MAYQQQYPPGQQEQSTYNTYNSYPQEPAVYNNWNNGAQQPTNPISAHHWNNGVPDAAAGNPGHWNNAVPQAQPGQWYQPPTNYAAEGIARAHNWVANQPAGSVMSPPPTVKTPFSEYGTDSADHHTIRSYPFPSASATATRGPPPQKEHNDRICGVQRTVFFIVLAIGAFVLVAGIATGLGVGLALAKDSSSTTTTTGSASSPISSAGTNPTSTPATPTTATSATSADVSPTPSFTGTLTSGPVICPANNNTVYVSSVTSKPFNIECGRDYNSANGAKELTNMATLTMADCIDKCGANSRCVGAGWGNYKGTYTCWLKSDLGVPNQSQNWYFAQLQSYVSNGS